MSSIKHKIKILPKAIKSIYLRERKWFCYKLAKDCTFLARINKKAIPWLWKKAGVNALGDFRVGYDVYFDAGYAHLITIEEGVWITARSLLFCHKRILDDYYIGDDYNALPYKTAGITLKKGCVIGMGSTILPGVTIGEGAIIGAGSLVIKDIPAWSIAVGNPCKIVKQITYRVDKMNQ